MRTSVYLRRRAAGGVLLSASVAVTWVAACATATMAAASKSDLFSQFAVDGLALGAKINPGGGAYREYKCGPSEQFPGFTYCTRRVTGARGESSFTILHDDERRTHYVTRTLRPAQFGPGDIDREIRRLSDTFGLRATRLQGPPGTPARASVIAYWGPLELQRLDAETVGRIAAGIPSKAGMLVDFLGNFQRSAREGLPLYALRGGYGYIYVASALDDDIPKLRLTAANPAVFVVRPPVPTAPTQSPLAFAEQERARTDALEAMRAATETRRQEEESRRLALEAQRRDAAQARKEAEQKQREEERRARFARLSDPARQLVADTSATISANPGMANLLDYVEQLAQLNDALGKGDPDTLEKRVATLSAALKNEPAYAEMIRRRQEEKDRQTALRLGRSQEVLKQRRAEVMRYLAEEPASSAAAAFLPLLRQIEPAMQTGTLDAVEPLSEKIELTIRQNNLEQRFARYAATPPPTATNGPALPRTPRTAVLLEGDADDLALFYNSSKSAPNVARNLRGDLDFANGIARVCIFQDAADERLKQEARDLTRAQSATAIDVVAPCPAATLASADIVALHRGSFLRLDSSKALSLIQLVEAGDYKPVTAKAGEARRQDAAERQRVGAEIEAGIVAKTRVGFGLLTLPNASSALCAILPEPRRVSRRLFCLSDAAIGRASACAW